MSFSAPLGLLGLLAVPAVLLLHTLRRRLVTRRVAGLFLFAPDALAEDAGPTRSPLLRTPSLWLELAAAAALGLLLGGPRLADAGRAPTLVVVLDDGASMAAVVGGEAAAERARDVVRRRLEALPSDGTATLLVSGRPPETLAGPRASRAAALAALPSWRPRRTAHDLAPALDLALELAEPGASVLLVTDRPDPTVPDRVEVVAVGRSASNAAILSARRFPSGADREALAVDVAAWAEGPLSTEVVVRAGEDATGPEVARATVVAEPERPARVTLTLARRDGPLFVALREDALAADGAQVVYAEPLRLVPYAVAMTPPHVAALRLERLESAVDGLVAVPVEEAALVLADAEGPAWPGTTRVVVAPWGAAAERDDWVGPFLLDRGHPLVEGLSLEGVVWSAGRGAGEGRGVVFAGTQALLAEDARDGAAVLRVNLDVERSTLVLAPDWPVLLSNVVERVRASLPGATARHARVGEALVFRSARATSGARFVAPSGREEPAGDGTVLVAAPREPGVHRLVAGGRELARWSVAFVDAAESDLRGAGTVTRPPRRAGAVQGEAAASDEGASPLVRALALAVLALATADAWVLSRGRRRRVAP